MRNFIYLEHLAKSTVVLGTWSRLTTRPKLFPVISSLNYLTPICIHYAEYNVMYIQERFSLLEQRYALSSCCQINLI